MMYGILNEKINGGNFMSKVKVGLQLFSIRDYMEKDMDAALKKVKEIGYDYVEMAGYFGKSAEEIRAILDKYDLKCISVHQGLDFYDEKGVEGAEFVKTLGAEFSVVPWYNKEELYTNMEGTIKKIEEAGKFLKENGLKLLYHNHDFEYVEVDGELAIDTLYNKIDKEYLNPEFDTCWVKYAGYEPTEYLNKYKGRIDVVHIKDFYAEKLGGGPVYTLIDKDGNEIQVDSKEVNKFEFRPVGSGIQDVKTIVEASIDAGAKYIIVEQDVWYDDDSLECAKKSREYLKSIGY